MRASILHGLVVLAGLGAAIAAGASCSGRPLVGAQNPNWRPVGCPQAGDPPIYVAKPDGDIFRLNPNNFGVERIGAATCPMAGSVAGMAVNRRGEIILSLGDQRAGRVRIQSGANPLSACESIGIERGNTTPITKFSGMGFVLRDEGDVGGDDLFLYATDDSELSTYLVKYTVAGQAPVATQPLRFAMGDRSDGFCRPPTVMQGVPPTCSGPRIVAQLAAAPVRTTNNRSLVLIGFAEGAYQLMFVDNPDDGRVTLVTPVSGIPIDQWATPLTATVWGESAFIFIGHPTVTPDPDAGVPMMRPLPDYTTVHRVPLATGVASADVGTLMFVARGSAVPPCMRYPEGS